MTLSPALSLPFEIGGEHIERITEPLFPNLLRRLLYAEAHTHGLPTDGIHVAGNTKAPDGGEDGRIEWSGDPDRTPNLPCRLNQFQLKAGAIGPAQAGTDVVPSGKVQPMVRTVLEAGGHYRMLCTRRYAKQRIEDRTQRMCKALRSAGITIVDSQITFCDADQIAAWANQHPAVAIWVKENTQSGTVGPFRSWTHWALHPDHDNSPWVPDERLPPLQARLRELAIPKHTLRLVAPSGIGKSRLALEAFSNLALADIVMYVDESEANLPDVFQALDAMVGIGSRAIIVVNHCGPKTHRILEGKIARAGSLLSLLTIDDEIPATPPDETTITVDDAPRSVVGTIIDRVTPNLLPNDRHRLEHFSEGFPRIAINVANAWRYSRPIPHAEGDDVVDAFVLGRNPKDPEHLLGAAMLVAAFGVVAVEDDYGYLKAIASFRHDLSFEDLHIGINRLVDRGVVRRKGRLRVLQPRPIAMRLAERQWRDWPKTEWDRLLTSNETPDVKSLRTTAARVLARLNQTDTAKNVLRHVLRPNVSTIQVDILPALTEVAPQIVLQRLEDVLSEVDVGHARRHVVSALKQIVFHGDCFDRAARILLRLAAAETETGANDATSAFVTLFYVRLGNTEASGDSRLALLGNLMNTADSTERPIIVEALINGLTAGGSRVVGPEIQGSRPALQPWLPQTKDAEIRYVTGCIALLASIAAKEVPGWPTDRARSGLGQKLRRWVSQDYMDALEEAVRKAAPVAGDWPEAIESLRRALTYDASFHTPDTIQRVEIILQNLRPTKLGERIRFLVTAMPSNYPWGRSSSFGDHIEQQGKALRTLALDLAQEPKVLEAALPQLSLGEQRMAFFFGKVLGELPEKFKPFFWRRQIMQAALQVPAQNRNLDLLRGYIVGISEKFPKLSMPLKKRLARTADFVGEFPQICSSLGIESLDIGLAVDALKSSLLAPATLGRWGLDNALGAFMPSELAPLIDALLAHEAVEALPVAPA